MYFTITLKGSIYFLLLLLYVWKFRIEGRADTYNLSLRLSLPDPDTRVPVAKIAHKYASLKTTNFVKSKRVIFC